jgi:hypothetical protein
MSQDINNGQDSPTPFIPVVYVAIGRPLAGSGVGVDDPTLFVACQRCGVRLRWAEASFRYMTDLPGLVDVVVICGRCASRAINTWASTNPASWFRRWENSEFPPHVTFLERVGPGEPIEMPPEPCRDRTTLVEACTDVCVLVGPLADLSPVFGLITEPTETP